MEKECEMKTCRTCGKPKLLGAFAIDSKRRDKLSVKCKTCLAIRSEPRIGSDADDTTVDYFLRDDYKQMRDAVIARVKRSVQGLSLRELRIFVQKKRLIDDGKLYLYLESILRSATDDGEIDEIFGQASRWRKVPKAKVIKVEKVEKIDYGKTNSQLFNHYPKQIAPFAENVYKTV